MTERPPRPRPRTPSPRVLARRRRRRGGSRPDAGIPEPRRGRIWGRRGRVKNDWLNFRAECCLGCSVLGWGPLERWDWSRPLFMSRQVLLVTARGRRAPAEEAQVFRRDRASPWCSWSFPQPSTGLSDAITTANPLPTHTRASCAHRAAGTLHTKSVGPSVHSCSAPPAARTNAPRTPRTLHYSQTAARSKKIALPRARSSAR